MWVYKVGVREEMWGNWELKICWGVELINRDMRVLRYLFSQERDRQLIKVKCSCFRFKEEKDAWNGKPFNQVRVNSHAQLFEL